MSRSQPQSLPLTASSTMIPFMAVFRRSSILNIKCVLRPCAIAKCSLSDDFFTGSLKDSASSFPSVRSTPPPRLSNSTFLRMLRPIKTFLSGGATDGKSPKNDYPIHRADCVSILTGDRNLYYRSLMILGQIGQLRASASQSDCCDHQDSLRSANLSEKATVGLRGNWEFHGGSSFTSFRQNCAWLLFHQ